MDSASTRRSRLITSWTKNVRYSGRREVQPVYNTGYQSIRDMVGANPPVVTPDASSADIQIKVLQQILAEVKKANTPAGWGHYLDPQKYYVRQKTFPSAMSIVQVCGYDPTRIALYFSCANAVGLGTSPSPNPVPGTSFANLLVLNRQQHYGLCTSQWYCYGSAVVLVMVECIDRSSIFNQE